MHVPKNPFLFCPDPDFPFLQDLDQAFRNSRFFHIFTLCHVSIIFSFCFLFCTFFRTALFTFGTPQFSHFPKVCCRLCHIHRSLWLRAVVLEPFAAEFPLFLPPWPPAHFSANSPSPLSDAIFALIFFTVAEGEYGFSGHKTDEAEPHCSQCQRDHTILLTNVFLRSGKLNQLSPHMVFTDSFGHGLNPIH